jgi:feruloyl esterase
VRAVRDGPRSSDGKPIWVGTAHGTPLTGYLALANTNCSAVTANRSSSCVGKPFPMSTDWLKFLVQKDPDYDAERMTLADLEHNYYLSRTQLESIIGGNDPDLSRFRAANRKMISWHGLADECITMRCSRTYYDRVVQLDAGARDYYRHFEAPGVNHCAGGNGSYYPLRALDALTRWVEGGIAPDVLIGYRMANDTGVITSDPDVTRPLCAYPDVLHYNGGDVDKYGSYTCGPKDAKSASNARTRDEL